MEALHSSLVSYPKRDRRFGKASYRGNADGRLLLGLIERYEAIRIADPMEGSGTSRDVFSYLWLDYFREPGIDKHDAEYWGADLHDGFDATAEAIGLKDVELCYLHPPYFNAVRFGDDPRCLANSRDYQEFRERLTAALSRCYESLARKGRLAVLVGDIRKRGVYTPIVRDVLNLEGKIGQLRSIIIKAQHNCASDRRTYRLEDPRILHEYLVVFKKQ